MTAPLPRESASPLAALGEFVRRSRRLFVLTGAGCSTESGIPDYRDDAGGWKHRRPTTYQRFVSSAAVRRRYWAGSLAGWERIAQAHPNGAHRALAGLETAGRLHALVTQNVDGLHQKAGSRAVVDLHGRLDKVVCIACRTRYPRAPFQAELRTRNAPVVDAAPAAAPRPDGDAEVLATAAESFAIPSCMRCGGTLKPDVVFFGEAIPPRRVDAAMRAVDAADAMLVVGSSLMVFSGYRFLLRARERGLPIAAVNLGRMRGDELLDLKVAARCGEALPLTVAEAIG